jgi:hypothetical protein
MRKDGAALRNALILGGTIVALLLVVALLVEYMT